MIMFFMNLILKFIKLNSDDELRSLNQMYFMNNVFINKIKKNYIDKVKFWKNNKNECIKITYKYFFYCLIYQFLNFRSLNARKLCMFFFFSKILAEAAKWSREAMYVIGSDFIQYF